MNTKQKKEFISIRGDKCEECGTGLVWNGKPLILQIHAHKTASPIVLCPNCHTQTMDYGGKNGKGKKRPEHSAFMKKHWDDTEKKLALSKRMTGARNPKKRLEQRIAQSIRMKNFWLDPKQREIASVKWSGQNNPAKRPEIRAKIRENHADVSGQNNPNSKTNREKRAKEIENGTS
jgi:hypothetical protein